MSMDDDTTKSDFLGATNMEKGIYDQDARFFVPYHRQVGLNVYELPILSHGVFHRYDYQFFYRNLQENVGVRLFFAMPFLKSAQNPNRVVLFSPYIPYDHISSCREWIIRGE